MSKHKGNLLLFFIIFPQVKESQCNIKYVQFYIVYVFTLRQRDLSSSVLSCKCCSNCPKKYFSSSSSSYHSWSCLQSLSKFEEEHVIASRKTYQNNSREAHREREALDWVGVPWRSLAGRWAIHMKNHVLRACWGYKYLIDMGFTHGLAHNM